MTTNTQHATGEADVHARDDALAADAAAPDPDTALRRMGSDLLMLWALCGKPACRRAQRCRRDPRSCARRYGPLAPEAARAGMLLTLDAIMKGIDEDALRARAIPEVAAFDAWVMQVEEAVYGSAPTAGRETDARP